MLAEMPLNAGLPLILDVMDDAEARLNFDAAWDSWLEEALDDEQFVSALERASRLGLGSPMEQLKKVAWELNSNHDLLRGNAFVSGSEPAPIDFDYLRRSEESWVRLLEFCESPDDRLYARLRGAALPLIANLIELSDSPDRVEALLASEESLGGSTSRLGSKNNWSDVEGRYAITTIRGELGDLQEYLVGWLAESRTAVIGELVTSVARMVLEQVEERRRTGQASFHDLLVWARDMLRDDPEARRRFQGQYRRLYVDEFQDTDPLQVEIVQLLAGQDADGKFAPGALFVVGDPKQSIYAFRRADVQMTKRFREIRQSRRRQFDRQLPLATRHPFVGESRFRAVDGRRPRFPGPVRRPRAGAIRWDVRRFDGCDASCAHPGRGSRYELGGRGQSGGGRRNCQSGR